MMSVLAPLRARIVACATLAVFGIVAACTEGRLPTAPAGVSSTRVSLSLSATVVGTAGRLMKVNASYAHAATAGTLIPLDSAVISLTGSETDLPVRLDIAACLADPAREVPAGLQLSGTPATCVLHVVLSLYDAGNHLLDVVALPPLSVTPGAQATAPPVQIGTSVGGVGITPRNVTLNALGFTAALNAVVVDQNGQAIVGPSLTWSSLAPTVAAVDPNTGAVTAKAVGSAKVVATSRSKADTANITVQQILKTLALSGVPAVMLQNDVAGVVVAGSDSNAAAIPSSALTIQFSSSNPSVLTVSAQGQVRAITVGTAQVIAQSGSISAGFTVTVNPAVIAKIIVSPSAPGIVQGATQQFSAVPQDASGNALAGRAITWSSSDLTVATINAAGVATAVAPGTVTITATSGTVSGTATLTVTPSAVGSIALSPSPANIVVGQALGLTAVVKDQLGNVLTGRTLAWSSSNSAIAAVDNAGVVTGIQSGSVTISASNGGVTGTATVNVSGLSTPVGLAILSQPGNGITGSALAPVAQARIVDANGVTVASATNAVTVALTGTGGVLSGVTTVNAVNGIATFPNLIVTGTGSFLLTFSAAGLGQASTSSFTVSALPATQLAMQLNPGGAQSGAALSPQPVVEIRNASNTVVTGATNAVTASLITVSGGPGVLSGTTTVNAVNGVASFVNLAVTGTGQYRFNFTSGTLASIQSAPFTVTALPAVALGIQTQPGGAVEGSSLNPQPVIQIRDATGAVVSGSTAAVTATLNGAGGVLQGTVTVNAVNGVATFTNLNVLNPGAYTITFSASSLTPVTSAAVTITPAPLGTINVTTQPANGVSGVPLGSQPVMRLFTTANTAAVTYNGPVTATLNGTGGTISNNTVNAVNGVVTFTNLTVTGPGTYTITFTAGAATTTSASFTVAPSFLGLNVGASATANAPQNVAYAVPVILDMSTGGGQDIASLSFDINFDTTKFTFTSVSNGTFGASGSYTVNTQNAVSGTVRVAITDNTGFNSGTPTVFTLTLTPKAPSAGSVITLTNVVAGDTGGTDITTKVTPRNQVVTIP